MDNNLRLFGKIILTIGAIVLCWSQFMEIAVEPDYANLEIEAIRNLPEKVINLDLVANKINYTIIGSLLIIVGIQLILAQSKSILVKEISPIEEEKNISNSNSGDANNPTALNDFIKKLNE